MPPFAPFLAVTALAALIVTALAALRAWSQWLALKHRELDRAAEAAAHAPIPTATRIDLADLKERIRKLEAIAAGVDL